MKEIIMVGLIKGRHEMPVENYIFDSEIKDVFDIEYISNMILDFLQKKIGITTSEFGICLNQYSDDDTMHFVGKKKLVVYVTGLSIVTAELIRLCALHGISLTLMHYDSCKKEYISQHIFS